MAMVPAICSQCGGKIIVDNDKDAGICEYCGTAFVTEKVINNYQNTINIDRAVINVAGVDMENLLLRAQAFEQDGEFEKAIEYYNRVLDIDIHNVAANEGLQRLKNRYIGLTPVSIEVCNEIERLMANGKKIEAIKCLRDATGHGLAAAKYFVEHHNEGEWEAYDLDKIVYGTTSQTKTTTSTTNGSQPTTQKSGGCYVATAVYGSYDCPQVWTLRRYRDDTLSETWYGRAFIRTYYAISPTLVKWFGNAAWFRNMWKPSLDRMVKKLNQAGVLDTPYEDK